MIKFNTEKLKYLFVVFYIAVFLGAGTLAVAAQVLDTSGPDSAYCVDSGYLYMTQPGVNGGRGICQFLDGTWCDAHAFFIGNCTPNPGIYAAPSIVTHEGYYVVPSSNYNPYYYNPYYANNPYFYNDSQAALDIADATKACQSMGGGVNSVHTPYGDVRLCVFPDGSSIDLSQLRSGVYGGTVNPAIYANGATSPVVYVNGVPGDYWYYYAYSWLNAP